MNDIINQQLNHRSIRHFLQKPVEQEKIDTILQAMIKAPTSSHMQTSSVIHVTDQYKKDIIADIASQPYISTAPEVFIGIVDLRRNMLLAEEHGYEADAPGMNLFFQGVADVYIMLQNANLALESIGLGAVFLGSVMNDPERLVNLLELPKYTFPIVGLAFGYPDDNPEQKPRMDVNLRYFKNTYHSFDSYAGELASFDLEMDHYYQTRSDNKRSDTFSQNVIRKLSNKQEKRDKLLKVAKDQGFRIDL